MDTFQKKIELGKFSRGFHLITDRINQELTSFALIKSGLCQIFLLHTSASIFINENTDENVRRDFSTYFQKLVPETDNNFLHTQEGDDDMPAHIKSALLSNSLLIPITNGELFLGTWQGVYLGEHRIHPRNRYAMITVIS